MAGRLLTASCRRNSTGTRRMRTPSRTSSAASPKARDVSTTTSCRLASSCASSSLMTPPPPPSGGYSKLTKRIRMHDAAGSASPLGIDPSASRADLPRRYPGDDRPVGHVFRDDRPGTDHGTTPDRDAVQHDHASPDPRPVADPDRALADGVLVHHRAADVVRRVDTSAEVASPG